MERATFDDLAREVCLARGLCFDRIECTADGCSVICKPCLDRQAAPTTIAVDAVNTVSEVRSQ